MGAAVDDSSGGLVGPGSQRGGSGNASGRSNCWRLDRIGGGKGRTRVPHSSFSGRAAAGRSNPTHEPQAPPDSPGTRRRALSAHAGGSSGCQTTGGTCRRGERSGAPRNRARAPADSSGSEQSRNDRVRGRSWGRVRNRGTPTLLPPGLRPHQQPVRPERRYPTLSGLLLEGQAIQRASMIAGSRFGRS